MARLTSARVNAALMRWYPYKTWRVAGAGEVRFRHERIYSGPSAYRLSTRARVAVRRSSIMEHLAARPLPQGFIRPRRQPARLCVLVCLLMSLPATAAQDDRDFATRVDQVLVRTPLIDGHNDLAWEIRERFKSNLTQVDLRANTSLIPAPAGAVALMTDIPRL